MKSVGLLCAIFVLEIFKAVLSTPIIICPENIYPCFCRDFTDAITCNSSDSLEEVRISLGKFYRQIDYVEIEDHEIIEIPDNTFHDTCVKRLNLKFYQLRKIHNYAFDGLSDCLQMLIIDGGRISKLPTAICELEHLVSLSLKDNAIETIKPKQLKQSKLDYLQLNNNSISSLSLGSFPDNLKHLALSHNPLKNLNKSLQNLEKLEWLFLTNTKLTSLYGELENLHQLDLLMLDNNYLENITETFFGLTNLTILNLSCNRIQKLENSLDSLQKLKKLNLSRNLLTDLRREEFRNLNNLYSLDLSSNRIKSLGNSLRYLENLKFLDLSGNQLKELDMNTFGCLIQLKTLDLSANLLKSLEDSIIQTYENEECCFQHDNTLKILNLAGNLWECDSNSTWIVSSLLKRNATVNGYPC